MSWGSCPQQTVNTTLNIPKQLTVSYTNVKSMIPIASIAFGGMHWAVSEIFPMSTSISTITIVVYCEASSSANLGAWYLVVGY